MAQVMLRNYALLTPRPSPALPTSRTGLPILTSALSKVGKGGAKESIELYGTLNYGERGMEGSTWSGLNLIARKSRELQRRPTNLFPRPNIVENLTPMSKLEGTRQNPLF